MADDEIDDNAAFIASLPYELPTFNHWTAQPNFYHPLMAGSIDGTDIIPHDRAVVRAMRSKYRPNKKVVGDPDCTIMVRHLDSSTKEQAVHDAFSPFGCVEKCRVVRDVITGASKGYAFVVFKERRDARNAVRKCQDLVIGEQIVVVDYEVERTLNGWIPRRFGGGLGGKKESGQLRFGGVERPFRRPIPVNSQVLGDKRHLNSDQNNRNNNDSNTGRVPNDRDYRRDSRHSFQSKHSSRDRFGDREKPRFRTEDNRRNYVSDKDAHRHRSRGNSMERIRDRSRERSRERQDRYERHDRYERSGRSSKSSRR